jgi:putative NIF3 family GTP cyclohydrolase 1 type 2
MKSLKTFMAIAALSVILVNLQGQIPTSDPGQTASAVIGKIIQKTGAPVIPNTVDVIKEGNPETIITGIVTTMFATMPVLKKAVEMNCNLVIVHEPLYYNHADQTSQFANDPVFLEKQKYIRDHKLVIWRFHDYIHSIRPDGILSGMVEKLGWKTWLASDRLDRFTLPETTLENLLKHLKKVFPGNAFYVIGDPEMKVTKVTLAPGAPGSSYHFRILGQTDSEVLIAGEVPQWETYEYMRDAVDQGRKNAVIVLGHINSEEAGMEYCADWLKSFIRDIPVSFIGSGPSYWSY